MSTLLLHCETATELFCSTLLMCVLATDRFKNRKCVIMVEETSESTQEKKKKKHHTQQHCSAHMFTFTTNGICLKHTLRYFALFLLSMHLLSSSGPALCFHTGGEESETSHPLPYIIHSSGINLALILDSLDVFQ